MKPSAIKTLYICVDIRGHAQRLLVYMRLSTPRLRAQLRQTSADIVGKSSPTLQTGMLVQNI
jgi:hypothetical protein